MDTLPETSRFPFSCQQVGQTTETLVFLVKLTTVSSPLPFSLRFVSFKIICPQRGTLRGTSGLNSQDTAGSWAEHETAVRSGYPQRVYSTKSSCCQTSDDELLMASQQPSAGPDQPSAAWARRPAQPEAATAAAQRAGDGADTFPRSHGTVKHQPQNSTAL